MDTRVISHRFPRASAYHPDWLLGGAAGGANPLWLTEWLCETIELRPGMKVLDLGCGRAMSSIFLHREFGAEVWATDLWFSAAENAQRINDAGCNSGVFPISANARSLPFAENFFDAIVSIDSYMYYGTDEFYLNYLARFVKPGGPIGIAQAGIREEFGINIPTQLQDWWAAERPQGMHSAEWWRHHWACSGVLDIDTADTLADGWKFWLDWLNFMNPESATEIDALKSDAGRNLGYVRAVARRRPGVELFDPSFSVPPNYTKAPLLRDV